MIVVALDEAAERLFVAQAAVETSFCDKLILAALYAIAGRGRPFIG